MGSSILEDLQLAYRSIVKRAKEQGLQLVEEEAVFILSDTAPQHMPQKGSKVHLVFDTDKEYTLLDYGSLGASTWLVCLLEDEQGRQFTVGYTFVKKEQ